MRPAVVIDRDSPLPLSRQIYDFWRLGILSGRFAGGERVPSTREVAAALGLSRGTITQAYEQLVSEGYFQTTHGAGTFVCRQLPEQLLHAPAAARRGAAQIAAASLSSFGKRLQQDYPLLRKQSGHVCLSHWGPDLSLFPLPLWHRLYTRTLRSLGPDALDYHDHVRGYEPLCEEIAKYLSQSRAVVCSPEQVIVVNGSQQGLDLCARLLLEPGDDVVVENPGYTGASRIFEACGARLRPVPVDAEGLLCDRLGDGARLAYVTPTHQFPTGVALSLRRRLELIAWARERRAIVIEDDYDSEYRYGGAPMPALQGLVGEVPVIYCGTFSKVMFPGLRVGYLVVPRSMIATFTRAKWLADRHTAVHQQATLYHFMREGHLERHIRKMRRVYGLRRAALMEALQRYFGDRASVLGEAAGMHAYVRFADAGVGSRAERNKVQLRDVSAYYLDKAPANDYLLSFSMLTERLIREGLKRIAP
ncbi:MAG TPA: PLP-dependent aminotransferase family protein [Steroidobacteraceae bacterium]|nr:PLP-dependent aminotransferase family protein [Steroidobacteraceae bacterium]